MSYIPPYKILVKGLVVESESNNVRMPAELFKLLLRAAFEPSFDSTWYSKTYADVALAVKKSAIGSEIEHFIGAGYKEGRLPKLQEVDESYYLEKYKDIASAIKAGKISSAHYHYNTSGYFEGRYPDSESEKEGQRWTAAINKPDAA